MSSKEDTKLHAATFVLGVVTSIILATIWLASLQGTSRANSQKIAELDNSVHEVVDDQRYYRSRTFDAINATKKQNSEISERLGRVEGKIDILIKHSTAK